MSLDMVDLDTKPDSWDRRYTFIILERHSVSHGSNMCGSTSKGTAATDLFLRTTLLCRTLLGLLHHVGCLSSLALALALAFVNSGNRLRFRRLYLGLDLGIDCAVLVAHLDGRERAAIGRQRLEEGLRMLCESRLVAQWLRRVRSVVVVRCRVEDQCLKTGLHSRGRSRDAQRLWKVAAGAQDNDASLHMLNSVKKLRLLTGGLDK